jgi:hypothetical protein
MCLGVAYGGHISSGVLLKVLDDVSHCRKPVNATNPILSAFNTKQVTDGSMGFDKTQNDSALGKFSLKFQQHFGAR